MKSGLLEQTLRLSNVRDHAQNDQHTYTHSFYVQDSETESEPEDMLECWDKMMNTDSDSG